MPKLNCQEVENLLEAFHDNELDGVSSLAVQEHLDECLDCRRQLCWLREVEASLQRLSESVPPPTQELRRRIRQPTLKQQPGPLLTLFRAYGRLAAVVSLALLFALAAIVLLTERTGADVMLFVRDSAKLARNANTNLVEFGTSDTEQAELWLKQRMGFTSRIPSPSGFKLVGARCCHINGKPVGLLLFERDGRRLSCYVGRSSMTVLRGFDDATPEGIRLGTCEGRHVAAWDAGDVSYLLVTDLTKETLLAVANEVVKGTAQSLKQ